MESYVNELIFEQMGLVTFLSTEGGESLCGVSAAKVDHVWHGRQEPGHCGVRSCEPISVSLFSLPAMRCEDRYEDPMGNRVNALSIGWFGVLVCRFLTQSVRRLFFDTMHMVICVTSLNLQPSTAYDVNSD